MCSSMSNSTDVTSLSTAAAADHLADAHQAVGYAGGWVNNADTKAGLLSAAVAVVIAATSQQAGAIKAVARFKHSSDVVAFTLFCLLGVAVTVALIALATALVPRTPPPQMSSRFGFPTLASPGWTPSPVTRAEAADEAWNQARVLSTIAQRKFVSLMVACVAVFVALPLYLAWMVAAALVT